MTEAGGADWRARAMVWWGRAQALRSRPRLMAILCGLLLGFAQPPFGFLPGLFGYAVLLWLLEGDLKRPKRDAFVIGWIAGFFYFFVGCFWVAEAFLVFADTYGWMAPFAATLLPAGIALFWGLFAVVYRWLKPQGAKRFLFFAAVFGLFEIIRGNIFTGFPWNPAGATWQAGGAISQTASVVGVYGLSFITVAAFAAFAVVRKGEGVKGWWPVLAGVAVIAICFIGGEVRLATTQVKLSGYIVRVAQPAVGQREKWSDGAVAAILNDYVALTKAPPQLGHDPDLIVWPEGALPPPLESLVSDDSFTAPVLATMLKDNQSFIMGVTRQNQDAQGHWVWRNSMAAFRQQKGRLVVTGFYDKNKLVPFGEIMPFQMLARKFGITALTHFDDSFTPGVPTRPVDFPGVPRLLPMICYEGIFPGLDPTNYRSSADPLRPRWILNISNDAWFGPTSGPVQHLNLASYRAIEEGLPMVRSTPTGISALIDPLGRVVPQTRLGPGQRGYRDLDLPLADELTIFSRHHRVFVILESLFCLLLGAFEPFVLIIKKNAARKQPAA